MAITITIGGNDVTAYVPLLDDEKFGLARFQIDEDAAGLAWRAKVPVIDNAGAVSIAAEDTVSIVDGATTLFTGRVAFIDRSPHGADTVTYVVDCQSKHVLLDETVVESESYAAAQADSAIIDDLFTTYLASIDSTTYVSTLDASMEALEFVGKTLRQCLTMIAARTGGRFFIDVGDKLHYFSAESNAAAWNLSDAPNFSTTYPYARLRERTDATMLIDKVLVIGSGVSGWVGAGSHEAIVWDEGITTAQGVTDRGNAVIAKYGDGLLTFTCEVRKDGLVAGMDIDVTNSLLGLSAETMTIRRLTMVCENADGSKRLYRLELGDPAITSTEVGRNLGDLLEENAESANSVGDEVFDVDAPSAPAFVAGNITTGVDEDGDGHQVVWIKVTWGSVADSDLDHYEIQCAEKDAGHNFNWPMIFHIQAGDTREALFLGLVGNVEYDLRVRAVDWVGNYSAWSPASPGYLTKTAAVDTTPPAQVTGEAAAGARTLIGVTWTANSESDLSHYEIDRAPDVTGSPGTFAQVATAKLDYYIDENHSEAVIAAATTYWYRIRAVDMSGNAGAYSGNVSASLNPIGSDTVAAGAIITAKLAAGAVTAAKITANTITANEIAIGTITATEIVGSTLSAIYADLGLVTAGEIRIGTGTVGVDFTGFRIYGTQIAGFNSDTLQAGIRASDGNFVCSGGNIYANATGFFFEIPSGTQAAVARSLNWYASATPYAIVGGFYASPGGGSNDYHQLEMRAKAVAARDTWAVLIAEKTTSYHSDARVTVPNLSLTLHEDADGSTIYAAFESGTSFNVYVNETANAGMTMGLTINQGANDDEAFALKSSDVAHGMTTLRETDTYFAVQKVAGASGGVNLLAYTEATIAASLIGYGTTANTAKTTAAHAFVEIAGYEKSGTTVGNSTADANIVSFHTRRGGSFIAVAMIDEDGDFYYDGGLNNYDEYDDALAVRDAAQGLAGRWNDALHYGKEALAEMGVITLDDEGEVAMVSNKRMTALVMGAVGQLWQRCQRYELVLRRAGLLEG